MTRSARVVMLLWALMGTVPGLRAAEPAPRAHFSAAASRQADAGTLTLTASIDEGWHVYALAEPDGGPSPLRITLPPESTVRLAGDPAGTPSRRHHDPSFDLDTAFYQDSFELQIPLSFSGSAANGEHAITVNVRFQACSDRECLPPRTLVLQAPVQIKGAAHAS